MLAGKDDFHHHSKRVLARMQWREHIIRSYKFYPFAIGTGPKLIQSKELCYFSGELSTMKLSGESMF